MAELGFKSAQDIVAFSHDGFLTYFGDRFADDDPQHSRKIADLIYRKAQQVNAVTFNLLNMARLMDTAPRVYAMFPPPNSPEEAPRIESRANLIQHFPTLEGLLGSTDFCECEHCRSVLSPAAYLVDLLKFLDHDDDVWDKVIDEWPKNHDDAPYPFKNLDELARYEEKYGEEAVTKFINKKPYDILTLRRPDISHLLLTCENTHTTVPYIDLVNEIFEYYVANWTETTDGLQAFEGYDTGTATSEELLAEPQNVTRKAYAKLIYDDVEDRATCYPLTLPFDLWLETARQFCDHFETPLWHILDVFRPTDALFDDDATYDQAATFTEYLGLSPAKYGVLTFAHSFDPLTDWYTLYGYDSHEAAMDDSFDDYGQCTGLHSAKTLSRRLDVSYQELVDIVLTGFINPKLKEEGDEDSTLVLADPDSGCSFDQTILRYANNNPADVMAFLKINLFVRLWKGLGWTIEETDHALQVFWPGDIEELRSQDLGFGFKTVLVYLAHLKALEDKLELRKDGRLKLLTLWSNLPTTGKKPLYAQLFLNYSTLREEETFMAFDHPLGKYLCYFDEEDDAYKSFEWESDEEENIATGNVSLKTHLLTIQGALELTANEISQILQDAGLDLGTTLDLDTAALSMDNVSLLYRYDLLAKALRLSVADLIALKGLSGLNPFAMLHDGPLENIDQDYPLKQTLGFVEMATAVKESGFEITELDYLLRHRFDPVGEYRPDPATLLTLVKSLATEIGKIQTEHAIPDAAALTDEMLQQNLALVLPPDVVETFMSLWTATITFEASDDVEPEFRLGPELFADEPNIEVAYDEVLEEQTVIHRGVLVEAEYDRLVAVYASSSVFISLLDHIHNQAQGETRSFFEMNFVDVEAPFLKAEDFDRLFAPPPVNPDKRVEVVAVFLPYLQYKLTQQLVTDMLGQRLNADSALIETLLTNPLLLTDPTSPDEPQPLLDAFIGTAVRGVTAVYFDETDTPLLSETQTKISTDEMPENTHHVNYTGYVEVPTSGHYRFYAAAADDAECELRFEHLPDPLLSTSVGTSDAATELKAGMLYRFAFEVSRIGSDIVALLVRGETLPKGGLNRLKLYPQAAVERCDQAQILLAKVLRIITGLGLNEREVRYLLTHPDDFDDLNFNNLPTSVIDPEASESAMLMTRFLRLVAYARLKRDLAGGSDDLIALFENARGSTPDADDLCQRLADLTRRPLATVQDVCVQFGYTVVREGEYAFHFAQEKSVDRIWQALQVVEKLGVPVATVVDTTRIVSPTATPDERFAIAQNLRHAIKARYETAIWQQIARPIFDRLRQRKRDALVAYIMHIDKFDRMEQLFESFLIDPGMEPVVQTSRVRLAISSVQLFIQRCLLNLEPWVAPSPRVINSQHWQWMKRYRVWEANRKFFLYPENWLEPEFRDDKTHLFRELESSLLQGDVSNELAENAFFNYLKKLEKLARLEIVTMYCEEREDLIDESILHVIGRTYNPPHDYFYRCYDTNSHTWTPWEPVTAQIEGDHVAAVVWQNRLHLFWLTFAEKAEMVVSHGESTRFEELAEQSISSNLPNKIIDVQLNWCEYYQGKWTTRESAGLEKVVSVQVANDFKYSDVFIHVGHAQDGEMETQALQIQLCIDTRLSDKIFEETRTGGHAEGGGAYVTGDPRLRYQDKTFSIIKKNAQPETGIGRAVIHLPYSGLRPSSTQFNIIGEESFRIKSEEFTYSNNISSTILKEPRLFSLLGYSNTTDLATAKHGLLDSKFFYQDRSIDYTFFVEPSLRERTVPEHGGYFTEVRPDPVLDDPTIWEVTGLVEAAPLLAHPALAPDERVEPIDPLATVPIELSKNWATDPAVILEFEETLIGPHGRLDTSYLGSTINVAIANGRLVIVNRSGLNSNAVTILDMLRSEREASHLVDSPR